MNVIFLDIDGVLVTSRYTKKEILSYCIDFDPECVENLKHILNTTNAKIVVTSTWRKGANVVRMKEHVFNLYGLGQYVVGLTPYLSNEIRGKEIQEYIERNKLRTRFKVDKFVILDDDNDMGELMPYLVQTDYRTGITKEIVDKVILILNRNT